MAKYIKLEDAIDLARTGRLISNNNFKSVCKALNNLPTIEVMEYPQVDGITPTVITPEASKDCENCKHENEPPFGTICGSCTKANSENFEPKVSEDAISRANTIKLLKDNKNYINADPYPHDCACDLVEIAPSVIPKPKEGEWIDCNEPPNTERNVFIAHGTDNMKSVCIGHYEHDLKQWYEDQNFFATPIYDGMYWCEIPEFPTTKGADDE